MIKLDTPRVPSPFKNQTKWGYGPNEDCEVDGMKVNYLFGLDDLCKKYINKDTDILELGCYAGVSSELLSEYAKSVTSVDGHAHPNMVKLSETKENVKFIHKSFQDFIKQCDKKFDLIYVDGFHDYANVKRDILLSLPLLKAGGIMCGHDMCSATPGVERAVKEIFPNNKIELFSDSSWLIKLNKNG